MVKMLAALLMLLGPKGPEEEYPALVAAEAAKQSQSAEELRAAHQALDEGRYAEAVDFAKHARLLGQEIARIRGETRVCLRKLVAGLVEKLDDDAFEARNAASASLRALGAAAIPWLVRLRLTQTSPESRCRIDELLQGVSVDASGRIHQWACDAAASSEYSPTDWSAKQIIGPPDTLQGGDARTAWAAKEADAGPEWIHLKYLLPVRISKLRILENYTPGGVVAVDVVSLDGVRRRAWEGDDPGGAVPVWFEVDLKGAVGREVVILLDTKKNSGWEEIDAVELIGELLEE
jgi:hypothetical protein